MSISLLAVDDEIRILELIQYAGKTAGCDVRVARTPTAFMASLLAQRPDLIVMDIVMPDMDGLELLKWLNQQACHAPIILVSGYDDIYLTTARAFASFDDRREVRTIRKPFRVENLIRHIRDLMDVAAAPDC